MVADKDAGERWSRLSVGWIVDGRLTEFRAGGDLGASMAALKLLLAIVLLAKNAPARLADPDQGSVMLSYDEFMGLTDLSRALVAGGVKRLEAMGLVTVSRGKKGEPSRYYLAGYGAGDRWSRISNRRMFRGTNTSRVAVLHELSPRRECDMNALKLYLLFSAFQDRSRTGAMLSYEKIIEYTSIPQGKIRRAISVLVEQGLIVVDKGPDPEIEKHNPPNRYRLLGIGSAAKVEEDANS